jgi:L-fuconolactonase
MRIDAHHHLWEYNSADYGWIGEQELQLKQNFLNDELAKVSNAHQIDGTVVVQARQSLEETDFLLSLASTSDYIKAVVGWVDLKSPKLEEALEAWSASKVLKGFRHVLQDEPSDDFMLDPAFVNGVKLIAERGYCYDILVFARQLPAVLQFIQKLPDIPLVIDHIAKPSIADNRDFEQWRKAIKQVASHNNVFCKISGMVTEADHQQWKVRDFDAYLDTVFECFGPQRVMFGSDWPVCLLAAEYHQVLAIVESYIERNFPSYKAEIMGLNAKRFYKI